jgi:AcrR family transcriptional regulator
MPTLRSLRDALIAHAADLLDAGEQALSLRAVARAAGVSAMAPYRHFSDKAGLLHAVKEQGFATLHEVLAAADARGLARSLPQALVEQGMAYVAFAKARPALFRLMFTSTDDGPPREATGGAAYRMLADRVATLHAVEAETAAMAAWSIVHGLAMLILDLRLPPEPAATRATLELFVAGL